MEKINSETTVEVGLKVAFERVKKAGLSNQIRMTEDEAALYWFSCGFKMGYAFARFVDKQEKTDGKD